MKTKLSLSLILANFIFLIFAINIKAGSSQVFASSIDLSISPPITYISLKPGEKKHYEIKVENLGATTLEITPSLLDFVADNQTGQPIIKETSTFPYVNIGLDSLTQNKFPNENDSILLKSRQKINIPITIDIPSGEPEKEHLMTIFFSFKNTDQENLADSKTQVAGTIGSNLIVLVTSNSSDKGSLLVKKITSWPVIDVFMPLEFLITAENIGKNATPASGSATITDWQNKEITQFEFHPDMVLAESSRELREKEFLSKEFRYKKPFLLGIYKINASLKQNSTPDAAEITLSKTVVALPFSIISLPLFGGLIYFGYKFVLRKTKSHSANLLTETAETKENK